MNVAADPKLHSDFAGIEQSDTDWTQIGEFYFRIAAKRGTLLLWRKEYNVAFFGGYQIKTIPLAARLAHEWVFTARTTTAA